MNRRRYVKVKFTRGEIHALLTYLRSHQVSTTYTDLGVALSKLEKSLNE